MESRTQELFSSLFSVATATSLLALLYLPRPLLCLLLSPVPITTLLLLTALLRLGSPPPPATPPKHKSQAETLPVRRPNPRNLEPAAECVPCGGPLEVIYEEYEGEEEDDGDVDVADACMGVARPLGSAGLCLTDSDPESSGDGSEDGWWEEEGLIEIALEEDGLIEIDISACR